MNILFKIDIDTVKSKWECLKCIFFFPGYSSVFMYIFCLIGGWLLMCLVTEGEVKVKLLSVTRECSIPTITHEISIYITICLPKFLPVAGQ